MTAYASSTAHNIFHQDFRMNAMVYQVIKHGTDTECCVCVRNKFGFALAAKLACMPNLSTEREIKSK